MRLTLRFRGELASNGNPAEKHKVRMQLHPQLEAYWQQHPTLKKFAGEPMDLQVAARRGRIFDVNHPIIGIEKFFWRYPLSGYNYIPLVPGLRECHCHLGIRLYRRVENSGFLFHGGDIDNRLKTFFDALQVPIPGEEVSNESADESPDKWAVVDCLLDNDRSITKFSIESLKLLTEIPAECKRPENYAEMEIDVGIIPITPMTGSIDLLFD